MQLENKTEEKLLSLLPAKEKAKHFRLKHKTTPQEIAEAEDLLRNWEVNVTKKDAEFSSASRGGSSESAAPDDQSAIFSSASASIPKEGSKSLPPVRGSAPMTSSEQPPAKRVSTVSQSKSEDSPSSKEEKGSRRLSGYDFRAWEKYDADGEANKIEEFDQDIFKVKPGKSYEELQSDVNAQRAEAHRREMEQVQAQLGTGSLTPLQRSTRANREKVKGNECFKAGEVQEAFDCYSRSLAFDASNGVTYANRAMAALKLSKFELAEDDCSRSIKLDPKYVKAWSRRGSTRFKRGKYREAVSDFETALTLTPADHPGRTELSNLAAGAREKYLEVEGRPLPSTNGILVPYRCDSLKAFASKALPPLANAEVVGGGKCTVVTFEGHGQVPKAESGTRIAITVESDSEDDEEEEHAPATTLSEEGEGEAAEGFRRIAIVEESESESEDEDEDREARAMTLKDHGNDLMKRHKYSDAERAYTEALSLCADLQVSVAAIAAFNNRSMARLSTGNVQGAQQDATQVLSREPANLKALYRRASASHQLGQHEKAKLDLTSLLAVDSNNKQASTLMVKVAAALEEESKNKSSQEALSPGLGDKDPTALKEQGNSAMAQKSFAKAEKLYSAALEADNASKGGQRALLLSNRSLALLKQGHFQAAESDASEAISLCGAEEAEQPLYSKALYRRALAYRGLGGMMHLNASIADLEALVAREPGNKSFAKELKTSQALLQEKGGKVLSRDAVKDSPATPLLQPQDIGLKEGKTTKRGHAPATKADAAPEEVTSRPLPPAPPVATKASTGGSPDKAIKGVSPQTKKVTTKRPAVPTEPPKTVFEMEKVWRALKSYPDLWAQYLAAFKKSTFKKCFKEAVNPDLLSSVFSALRDYAEPRVVVSTLEGLVGLASFSMTLALLPGEDLAAAQAALEKVDEGERKSALLAKFR